jgi:hypothetical protein
MLGFIDTLYYNAIANLPTSEITRTRSVLVLLVLFCTPTAASFGIRLSYISSARTTQHRKHSPTIVL